MRRALTQIRTIRLRAKPIARKRIGKNQPIGASPVTVKYTPTPREAIARTEKNSSTPAAK
jgi:hypothetical protein